MPIKSIQHENRNIYFVADDLGQPVSFGYPSIQEAEEVEELIKSSAGSATIPEGINVEAILAD